MADKTMK